MQQDPDVYHPFMWANILMADMLYEILSFSVMII